jgi:tetratricopeptide (TPR) repeat protein
MRRAVPGAPIALATGRAVVSMRLPVGEVIDRAVKMLRSARFEEPSLPAAGAGGGPGGLAPTGAARDASRAPVALDEVTAGLLDARFDVGGDDVGLVLRAERDPPSAPARTLLGRPTPCVGRDAELSMLDAMFEAAVGDPGARAILVTAPAGVGKSRLRHEFVRRLEALPAAPQVWMARGDPMSAGAPFGLIGAAVRRAAGIHSDERIDLRRRKLRARVGRHLHPDDAARIAEFIGELCGTPFPSDQSVQLRTALQDSMLLGDQMRRAWEDWLAAEADARPLVLVLEDLQWGDRPTVTFVDAALRHLRERPFLALGLARPEVHALFQRLWADRGVQEIRLADLPRRASERLVRQVLGERADEAVVQRLAARAAGNAFYLEELIRAAAEGRGDELPETVLAMVQARIEALDATARRVLRAASVFGQEFTGAGVAALLGGAQPDAELGRLVDGEWLTRAADAYTFRHGLVRDAAYAMLTEQDRTLGHQLAAAWLEASGEPDPLVLAEHFERGGEAARAIEGYRRAAEQALGGNDLAAVVERVARAASLGAAGATLGELRLLEAEALRWRGELASAERAAQEALRWLPQGGDDWYLAAEEAAFASGSLGDRDRLVELATILGDLPDGDRATAAQVRAALRLAVQLAFAGRPDLGDRLSAAIDGAADRFENSEPTIAGRILAARASRAHFVGNPALYLELLGRAIERFEHAGDLRGACMVRGSAGWACLEIGDYPRGEAMLREVLATAERMGLANVAATAKQNLGLALLHLGRLEEARQVAGDACRMFAESGNRRLESASRAYLAQILLRAGDARGAERNARAAIEVASGPPSILPCIAEGCAVLARVLLDAGRPAEAREAAARGMGILGSLGGIDGGESSIRLVHAEALHAAGARDEARQAVAAARARLLARAERIPSPELRASFLERVPDNARTLALARAWEDAPHT